MKGLSDILKGETFSNKDYKIPYLKNTTINDCFMIEVEKLNINNEMLIEIENQYSLFKVSAA